MYKIEKIQCITLTEKLLWNIQELLIAQTGHQKPEDNVRRIPTQKVAQSITGDLSGLKRNELFALAKENGLKVPVTMKNAELIAAIQNKKAS